MKKRAFVNGVWFRGERLRLGMTVDEFAKHSGVAEGTILRIESGIDQHLADKTLIALAKAIKMDVVEFEKAIYAPASKPKRQKGTAGSAPAQATA